MAARKERKVNYADRHWTDKPLDQMKERDWRIFKEDFNIACKGTVDFIPCCSAKAFNQKSGDNH